MSEDISKLFDGQEYWGCNSHFMYDCSCGSGHIDRDWSPRYCLILQIDYLKERIKQLEAQAAK